MPNRYAFLVVAATLGVAIGLGAALLRSSRAPAAQQEVQPLSAQASWPSGAKRAPAFSLRDQAGRMLSLSALRGHPVLLTFLDSVCKKECPLEGRALRDV